jgi:hypothetical protein
MADPSQMLVGILAGLIMQTESIHQKEENSEVIRILKVTITTLIELSVDTFVILVYNLTSPARRIYNIWS